MIKVLSVYSQIMTDKISVEGRIISTNHEVRMTKASVMSDVMGPV